MTRTRNASFVGTAHGDGDVDAVNFTRVLREVNQDLNLVHDIITGDNGISLTDTMDHSGGSLRGSLLGIPVVNQTIGARIEPAGANIPADLADYFEEVYLLGAPVLVAAGETEWTVEVDAVEDLRFTLSIYDATGTHTHSMDMEPGPPGQPPSTYRAQPAFAEADTSALYIFLLRVSIGPNVAATLRDPTIYRPWTLGGWRIHPTRLINSVTHLDAPGATPFPVPTDEGLAWHSGKAIVYETIHDEMFNDDAPTPGWIVDKLNRNASVLWEALTGAPVPGNGELTISDSSDVNPTTSRFIAHTTAGPDLVDEAALDFPLFAEGFGAVQSSADPVANEALTNGLANWAAPWMTSDLETTVRRLRCYVPDFPAGADSRLYVTVLVVTDGKGNTSDWVIRGQSSIDVTAPVNLTQVGSTPLYLATCGPLDFTPDALEDFSFTVENPLAAAPTYGEVLFLGWAGYFTRS